MLKSTQYCDKSDVMLLNENFMDRYEMSCEK